MKMSYLLVMRHTSQMNASESRYHRHRFPTEINSHCVWLYFRFSLRFRDVEEILAMRGVGSHLRNRPGMAPEVWPDLCRRPTPQVPRPGDRWHLDEVFLKINGRSPLPLARGSSGWDTSSNRADFYSSVLYAMLIPAEVLGSPYSAGA
jgi:hypothetical protein